MDNLKYSGQLRFPLMLVFLLFTTFICSQEIFKKKAKLMGVNFEFALVANDSIIAQKGLNEAIKKSKAIESQISSWQHDSQTSLVNRMAGIQAVHVDVELFNLIDRSLRVSKLTDGAFDISFASINKYWSFHGQEAQYIDSVAIANSIKLINYKDIILDHKHQTVFLKNKGMRIGFGAIGKGYLAEQIMNLWKELGFEAGLINASGDIRTFGNHPKTVEWKVGIKDPDAKQQYLAWFDIKDAAVVTSGNYENYVIINGEKYGHIINPLTGWPTKGVKSVTVFCKNAELADALATAVSVLGRRKGMELINELAGVEAMILDAQRNSYFSKNLKIQTQ